MVPAELGHFYVAPLAWPAALAVCLLIIPFGTAAMSAELTKS